MEKVPGVFNGVSSSLWRQSFISVFLEWDVFFIFETNFLCFSVSLFLFIYFPLFILENIRIRLEISLQTCSHGYGTWVSTYVCVQCVLYLYVQECRFLSENILSRIFCFIYFEQIEKIERYSTSDDTTTLPSCVYIAGTDAAYCFVYFLFHLHFYNDSLFTCFLNDTLLVFYQSWFAFF